MSLSRQAPPTGLVPAEGVLHGTIGALVLRLAETDRRIGRGPVTLDEALGADEAFITSSVRGVVPIVEIDGHKVGDGTVGPVTTELMARCREAMRGEDDR